MKKGTIQANGLNFAYYEAGSGPLALCLHGFPDTAETWSHLLPQLADAGYRAVAPNLRGYLPTEIPSDADYSAVALGQDVLRLIEAFGEEQAVVIAHDWGALAAYSAANQQPERISKLVTVAIPHPRSLRPSLGGLWKARHFITYQFRNATVRKYRGSDMQAVDEIYRRWSPNWVFDEGELTAVKESFRQPGGVEAALGFYWSFWADARNSAVQKVVNGKTAVNTLTIVGDSDGALSLDNMPRTRSAFTGSYDYKILPQVGHFLHREAPDLFADTVFAFL